MSGILSKTLLLYKESYSGHPREIWSLAILTFINRFGTMVLPFLTVYLTTVLGFSLKEAGLLVGAFGFGSLAGSYGGGRLSDRFGANIVIVLSLLLSGVFFIFLQWAYTFDNLFILIFLTALFGEAYRPAMMASVGDYVPLNKTGRTMAFIRLAVNLGWSAAPFIGGFVAATLGYKWLFWIDGLTCISAAIYFGLISRKWEKPSAKEEEKKNSTEEEAALPPLKNRNYLLFLIATFLMGFAFIQWFHSVPVFIKSEWGFDERYIGIMMGMNGLLIVLIEMPAIHAIEKAKKIMLSVLAGLFFISISFLPFLLPKALIFCFLAMFFFTLGEIFYLPFNNSIPLNMSPLSKRGEYMSWYWMTWSLTNITGPIFGLAFIDTFGFPAFWTMLSILVGISLIMNVQLKKSIDL